MQAQTPGKARPPVARPVDALLHSPPAVYLGGAMVGVIGSVLALLAVGAL
ncbi:MAG: hypothetical protein U0R71_00815 [Solirubrobacterales bacterium]